MITFKIGAGQLLANDGTAIGPAYSGAPGYVDKPAFEYLKDCGPIPEGLWAIGEPYDHPKLGPFVMNLSPVAVPNTYARGDFRIHGDNAEHNQTGSEGCIVAGRLPREAVWADVDHLVNVVV